jgi:uncharacterized repeat protein (TIGR02543 family)
VFATFNTANGPGVTTYTVNSTTGALTALATPPTISKAPLGNLAVNPAGTFLFATSTNSAGNGTVSVFSIAANGTTTELPASPFGISNPSGTALSLVVGRDGKYLYVGSQSGITSTVAASIDVFSIAADGTPTVLNTYTLTPAVEVGLFLHPTGAWLYNYVWHNPGPPDSGLPSYVQQYNVNADGTLTAGPAVSLEEFSSPGLSLTGSPDGTFVFVGHGMVATSTIAFLDAFAVNSVTGNLGEASTFSGENLLPQVGPSSGTLAVDSTSTYVYTNAGGFTFPNGILTPLSPLTPTLNNASLVVAAPTSPFLFAALNDTLATELVNGDGTLTAAPGAPTALVEGLAVTGVVPVPTQPDLRTNASSETISNTIVGQTPGIGGALITNWGYSPLVVSNVSLSGDPSFAETNTCTTPIPPMGTCLVNVTFTPTVAGTFNATLTLQSNSPTQTVAITGMAINPFPEVVPAPQSVLFPDTQQGSSSSPVVVTFTNLQNAATGPFVVQGVTIGGSNPEDFSQTNTCAGTTIAIGASCTVSVTFTPAALGARAGSVTLTNANPQFDSGLTLTGNSVTTVTKFTFSTIITGPGTVQQTPAGSSFANNTTINLKAVPNANSSFVTWGAPCPQNEGDQFNCTLVLTQNTGVSAQFVANVSLTTNVVGPGTVTQSPTGTSFLPGTAIILTEVPNTGAIFVGWTPANLCSPATGLQPNQCFVNLTANTTATATFAAGAQVTLATNVVGSGTIQQSPAGTSFASGTSITLTAVPNPGAAFTGWTGPCASSTNPVCIFVILANTTATAMFTPQFTLSTSVVGPGTIRQSPSGASFNPGTSIALTAVPGANAVFTSWSGPCAGSTNPVCTFAISANTTATATFTQQFTLTTSVVGPGTIQQSPTGTSFASGTSITLTAVPNTGATFTNWAGACAGNTNAACAFTITANTTATATFAAGPTVTPSQPMQMGAAGSAFTFPISTSGFAAPPTLTASCSIPEGTCTISGTTLTVTTTARPAGAVRVAAASFPAPPAASSPSAANFARGRAAQINFAPLRSTLFALLMMLTLLMATWTLAASPRVRRALRPVILIAPLALLVAVAGCGGGGSTPPVTGTPAGTYHVTITATSGAQTAMTIVTVVVQ